MNVKIIEISGYVPAISAMYISKMNLTQERLEDIIQNVDTSMDSRGRVINPTSQLNQYLDNLIKYGIKHEHETLLDYIKISIFMKGLHRGAQDDYDAHSKRMDIVRVSSRYKEFEKTPEISDWYKDKIIGFNNDIIFKQMPTCIDKNNIPYFKTQWGYVREDWLKNGDACRGLVPLAVASDNVSTLSFRHLRHIYHVRRQGTTSSPELQIAIEDARKNLTEWCPQLGEYLGKVWCEEGFYHEKNQVKYVPK